jgi:hypothetical protein
VAALGLGLVMRSSEVHAAPSAAPPQPRPGKSPGGAGPRSSFTPPGRHQQRSNRSKRPVNCEQLLLVFPLVTARKGHHTVVRILPPQPGSLALRETIPISRRKACQWRVFPIQWTVSRLPISRAAGRNCQKSPAACRNIPIFGRRGPETGFRSAMRGRACSVTRQTLRLGHG